MESLRRAGLKALMILLYLVAGKSAGELGGRQLYLWSVRPVQREKRGTGPWAGAPRLHP